MPSYAPVHYRDHTIELSYERCRGGWEQWYYAVFRDSDGYECTSGFEDSVETYQTQVENFKRRIDNELAETEPWCEKEGLGELTA